MKKSIFILILLGAAVAAPAQIPRQVVTLDECRKMAVENNAKVKIAESNLRSADETRREAFTKYFPTVTANALSFWSNKPVIHYEVMDMFAIEFMKKGFGANITAVQPVFAGGRIVNGNKLAAVGVEAGRLEHQGTIDEVALTAEQYYWQIATLKAKRHTLDAVIDMLDTLRGQVQTAVDAGVVLSNDLLKVNLKRNQMLSLQVDLDNGIELSQKLLAQYIGLDGTPIDIDNYEVPSTLPSYPTDIFMEPAQALPSTTDYQLLQQQVKAADLKAKMAVGDYLPTVGVGAGYFYDDLLNQKYSFGALFVSVSVPISNWWGGSHAISRSKLDAANARTQLTDLSQMLQLKMDNNWDDLTAAYRKMQIARESIAQAEENLRLSRNQYNAGVATITDLLDAQTLYRQSEDEYTEAYGNFRLCRARYLDATGQSVM